MVGAVTAPEARKPNWAVARAPSAPFQDTLRTVIVEPDTVGVPFHIWLITCPPASVQVTCQLEMAAAPAVTVTCPWKPPCHVLVVW